MKSILLSIIIFITIYLNGASQVNQKIDTLSKNDTNLFPNYADENVYVDGGSLPEFPGGNDSLIAFAKRHMNYPKTLIKDSIEGRILFRFSIDDKGVPGEVHFMKGLHPELEKQCIDMVNQLPRFKPGTGLTNSGIERSYKPVKMWMLLPVYFAPTNRNQTDVKVFITP